VLWRAPWFQWVGFSEQAGQSPHGRDGHGPFFCDAKFNFKGSMVLGSGFSRSGLDARKERNGFTEHMTIGQEPPS